MTKEPKVYVVYIPWEEPTVDGGTQGIYSLYTLGGADGYIQFNLILTRFHR